MAENHDLNTSNISLMEATLLERVRELKPFTKIEIRLIEGRVSIISTSTLKEDFPL